MALGVASFAFILAVWSLLTYTGMLDPLFLPTPTKVAAAAFNLLAYHGYLNDVIVTVFRVFAGFFLAVLIGVPLGILVGTYKPIEAMVEPVMAFVRYMPASAFLPLFIIWIGINEPEKVAVIFFGSFFQLVLMVATSTSSVPQELVEVSYTLGTSPSRVLWRVLLPGAWPAIVDNLRIILGWAWTYVIVAELIGASSGMGFMIIESQRMLRTWNIIAGIVSIGILGLVADYGFKWSRSALFPWAD